MPLGLPLVGHGSCLTHLHKKSEQATAWLVLVSSRYWASVLSNESQSAHSGTSSKVNACAHRCQLSCCALTYLSCPFSFLFFVILVNICSARMSFFMRQIEMPCAFSLPLLTIVFGRSVANGQQQCWKRRRTRSGTTK